MNKGGKFLRQNPSGGKKNKKAVLIAFSIVAVLILVAVIAGVAYYNHLLDGVKKVEVEKIDYAALATETFETLETLPVESTEETTEATTEQLSGCRSVCKSR